MFDRLRVEFAPDITEFDIDFIQWDKNAILNGDLPVNVTDGSVLYITGDGKFNNTSLITGDYIQLYDNMSKFVLNRVSKGLDSDSVGDGLEIVDDKVKVKLNSDSLLITADGLSINEELTSKTVNYPTAYKRLYENLFIQNQANNLILNTNIYNIFIYNLYTSGPISFNNIQLAPTEFQNGAVSVTITMLFTNMTEHNYITWPYNFIWSNDDIPVFIPGKRLLVTGIFMGSLSNNNLLCSYSIF